MLQLGTTQLCGSYPPLVTPFRDGRVDFDTFAALVDRQAREGSHGIVVCGTTGEATSLTVAERIDLVRHAVAAAAGRLPVVAGTGAASFEETCELTRRAEQIGVEAALVVTPYYVRPSQAALTEYFVAVGQRTGLPLILYHIPARAAVSLAADTICRISDRLPHLVGIKHASPDLDLVSALRLRLGWEFRIFGGLESLSLPMLAVGASGLMNAVGNLAPAAVAALYEAAAAGRLEEARQRHFALFELNQAIFFDTNPVPLKYMMKRLGLLPSAEVRLPLVPLDEERARAVDAVLERGGWLAGRATSHGPAGGWSEMVTAGPTGPPVEER
jgi:4-hydroxy-tetrahydrodipicolinate synthase